MVAAFTGDAGRGTKGAVAAFTGDAGTEATGAVGFSTGVSCFISEAGAAAVASGVVVAFTGDAGDEAEGAVVAFTGEIGPMICVKEHSMSVIPCTDGWATPG